MFRGVLLRESLVSVSVIDRLSVLDTEIVEMPSPAVGQPATWTLVTFEVDDAHVAAVAEALVAEVADGPRDVDFNNGERSYVVFSDHVFTYVRGDEVTLRAARAHARRHGVPESQIDWAVPG